jgi:hypothetical protein
MTSKSAMPSRSRSEQLIYQLADPHRHMAIEEERTKEKEAAEEAQARKTLESFLANPHSSVERPNGFELIDLKEPGWTKPAVFVVFPFPPIP